MENDTLEFFVHPSMPRECFAGTVRIKSDGYCGFRTIAYCIKGDQDAFMEVKKEMHRCFRKNKALYAKYFTSMYNLDKIERTIAYGLDLPESNGEFSRRLTITGFIHQREPKLQQTRIVHQSPFILTMPPKPNTANT